MKLFACVVTALCVLILSGCAITETALPVDAKPVANVGYVGGDFTLTEPTFVLGFVLVNQQTQQEFLLPFSFNKDFQPGQRETRLLPLAPGTYKVAYWTAYNRYWGSYGREFKKPPEGSLAGAFNVEPGKIVFLGQFAGQSVWQQNLFVSTTDAFWTASKLSQENARQLIKTSYPAFSGVPLDCILCTP
jgi:hypothetical protein